MRFTALLFAVCVPVVAQSSLPEAPTSSREQVRPLAIGISGVERIVYQTGMPVAVGPGTMTTVVYDFLPSIYFNYRFDGNRFNANTAIGRSSHSGNYSLTTSLSMNLFKFGHVGK